MLYPVEVWTPHGLRSYRVTHEERKVRGPVGPFEWAIAKTRHLEPLRTYSLPGRCPLQVHRGGLAAVLRASVRRHEGIVPMCLDLVGRQLDTFLHFAPRILALLLKVRRRNLGALPRKVSSWWTVFWDDPLGGLGVGHPSSVSLRGCGSAALGNPWFKTPTTRSARPRPARPPGPIPAGRPARIEGSQPDRSVRYGGLWGRSSTIRSASPNRSAGPPSRAGPLRRAPAPRPASGRPGPRRASPATAR
jgi:hypothetical protein